MERKRKTLVELDLQRGGRNVFVLMSIKALYEVDVALSSPIIGTWDRGSVQFIPICAVDKLL